MICSTSSVFANEYEQEDNYETEEYEAQLASIMTTYTNNPEAACDALSEIGAVLLSEPIVVEYTCSESGILRIKPSNSTLGTNPTDYTLSVYASQKADDFDIIYLQFFIYSYRDEWFSGPLDFASIEWDTQYASYYLSNGDSNMSTVQGRSNGIVLFNIQDNKLDNGTYTYGTVRVRKIYGQHGEMEFGTKFVHTFKKLLLTGSVSTSFSPSIDLQNSGEYSLGLTYTYGYVVNYDFNTDVWQLWNDNAVFL